LLRGSSFLGTLLKFSSISPNKYIVENERLLEGSMIYVALWFAIGGAYLLSMILICRCMNLGDKKYVKVIPSQIDRRR
jgi:hypothetical protein